MIKHNPCEEGEPLPHFLSQILLKWKPTKPKCDRDSVTVETGNFWPVTQPLLVLSHASALRAIWRGDPSSMGLLMFFPGRTEEPVVFF